MGRQLDAAEPQAEKVFEQKGSQKRNLPCWHLHFKMFSLPPSSPPVWQSQSTTLLSNTASQRATTPPHSQNHSRAGSRRSAHQSETSRTEPSRATLQDASLSWRLWRWPSWAAGSGSRGCGTPGAGRGRCCRPAPGHTAAGLGWAASDDNSLYRTRCHSSWWGREDVEVMKHDGGSVICN